MTTSEQEYKEYYDERQRQLERARQWAEEQDDDSNSRKVEPLVHEDR